MKLFVFDKNYLFCLFPIEYLKNRKYTKLMKIWLSIGAFIFSVRPKVSKGYSWTFFSKMPNTAFRKCMVYMANSAYFDHASVLGGQSVYGKYFRYTTKMDSYFVPKSPIDPKMFLSGLKQTSISQRFLLDSKMFCGMLNTW